MPNMKRDFVLSELFGMSRDEFTLVAGPEIISYTIAQPWIQSYHLIYDGTYLLASIDPRYDAEECWLELAYALENISPFDIWATAPEMRKD